MRKVGSSVPTPASVNGSVAANRPLVPNQLTTPVGGVRLTGGVLKRVFDDNLRYLLDTYALDSILYRFRERAGAAHPPNQVVGWERERLYGSPPGKLLHFAVTDQTDCEFMPYYEIRQQRFTCVPVIEA
jgi:hypothetical protein